MFTYVKNIFTNVKVYVLKLINVKNDFTAKDARALIEKSAKKNLSVEARKYAKMQRKIKRIANSLLRDLEYLAKHNKTILRLSKIDFRYNFNYSGDLLPIALILRERGFTAEISKYDTDEDDLLVRF